MTAAEFARKLRQRERIVGYWTMLDAPPATERIARLGYDYVCLDGQHGLIGYSGLLNGVTAIDAACAATPLIRPVSNDPGPIGRALDTGAGGVIVPLVNTPEEAARAVRATRYPPRGIRSYGPVRSDLRIGPTPADADDSVVVIAMIETAEGLANVDEIAASPGLDAIYVGPADLCLAVGGSYPGDPQVADEFGAAVRSVREAAARAGIAAGIHTNNGETAAHYLDEGFTFATVSCDVQHLEQAAAGHLERAQGREVRVDQTY